MKEPKLFILMFIKLSATTLVILHFWILSGLCTPRRCRTNAQKHDSSASSDPGALYYNSPGNHIIHSPVVLEEEKRDEGWEKEGNWKVLVQSPNGRSVGRDRDQSAWRRRGRREAKFISNWISTTHADRDTLVAGTTSTLSGWTRTDESQVTTRSPTRNFPGVAPPAPQMHTIWKKEELPPNCMEAFQHFLLSLTDLIKTH